MCRLSMIISIKYQMLSQFLRLQWWEVTLSTARCYYPMLNWFRKSSVPCYISCHKIIIPLSVPNMLRKNPYAVQSKDGYHLVKYKYPNLSE